MEQIIFHSPQKGAACPHLDLELLASITVIKTFLNVNQLSLWYIGTEGLENLDM